MSNVHPACQCFGPEKNSQAHGWKLKYEQYKRPTSSSSHLSKKTVFYMFLMWEHVQ